MRQSLGKRQRWSLHFECVRKRCLKSVFSSSRSTFSTHTIQAFWRRRCSWSLKPSCELNRNGHGILIAGCSWGRLWSLTLYSTNENGWSRCSSLSPCPFIRTCMSTLYCESLQKDWNPMAFEVFLDFLESLFSSWSASFWRWRGCSGANKGWAMIRNSVPACRHDEIDILWKDLCCFDGSHFCFWMICIYPFPWRWEQIMKFFEMLSSEHRGSSPTVSLPRQRKKCYGQMLRLLVWIIAHGRIA